MTRVRQAQRDDALIVAALALASGLDDGAPSRPGFIDEYADAWLADFDHRPTWLAVEADNNAVGFVQAVRVTKLPSLRRPVNGWLHVSLVFVRPAARGQGIAEQLLREMIAWGEAHEIRRYQLNADPKARSLYERVGFGAPSDALMERISQ